MLYMDNQLFSISDAANYLKVSVQTLRRWDRSGKLKSTRHPVSRYRYYRLADLEPFKAEISTAAADSLDIGRIFKEAAFYIEGNDNLREPQKEAHRHTKRHFASSSDAAILQIPVGCGKTGVMATLPFGIAFGSCPRDHSQSHNP